MSTTFAELYRPVALRHSWAYDAALMVASSVLLAASAQVSVRLPFSPVPVTLQTLTVLLLGTLLGSRRGPLAVMTYLLEGAAGLPVFAGFRGGLPTLLGPTGGYLLGFVAAAWIAGRLTERGWDRRLGAALLALTLANAAIYLCGLPWLTLFVGWRAALPLGLLPFLAGDVAKVALAAGLLHLGAYGKPRA